MELLKKNKIATGALCILAIAGLCAYVFQLMGGLGVTGMNNGTSWGLYITMFMLFVGLSAGGLIVASSASVFHIEKFKKVALPAACSSLSILAGCTAFGASSPARTSCLRSCGMCALSFAISSSTSCTCTSCARGRPIRKRLPSSAASLSPSPSSCIA